MPFNFALDAKGYIKKRESFDVEYKQNFQGGDNLLKYVKSLIGMANNRGGQLIFGIKDSPHIPLGMTNSKFTETDPAKIDRLIREYFSQEILWEMNMLEFNGNAFGQLVVSESESKPILCKKNKDTILREGAIYYRYRAETKEIEFAELKKILELEREKERILWIKHIEKIAQVGPNNVSLFDTYNGEISVGKGRILLDKSIVDKLKFIKKGKFVESEEEGAPTLRLVGEIEGLVDTKALVSPDKMYPLLTKDLINRLSLNSHEIKCILWKMKIKGNNKYHTEIKLGEKSNPTHKYTEALVSVLERLLKRELFLDSCKSEFSAFQKRRKAN